MLSPKYSLAAWIVRASQTANLLYTLPTLSIKF